MSRDERDPTQVPISNEVAAVLRHDLVTPINLIVGYCDLMIGEASDLGQIERIAPLRLIRAQGFALLNLIDRSLLDDHPGRSVADIQALGRSLSGPATVLMETCDTLIASAAVALDPTATAEFDEDLRKVRAAGAQMAAMGQHLATEPIFDGVRARTLLLD